MDINDDQPKDPWSGRSDVDPRKCYGQEPHFPNGQELGVGDKEYGEWLRKVEENRPKVVLKNPPYTSFYLGEENEPSDLNLTKLIDVLLNKE